MRFMATEESVTSEVFIEFLKRLMHKAQHPIFLIVDNHSVHKSSMVQEFVEGTKGKLWLFYLPPYSPELNPDEMLNQDVKTNAVGRKRSRNRPHLMRTVRRYLERRRGNPDLVRRYFHEPSVRYAAT